jgi:hypothetical protein
MRKATTGTATARLLTLNIDAITQYIILENPDSTERARDVALRALMRAYPCKR